MANPLMVFGFKVVGDASQGISELVRFSQAASKIGGATGASAQGVRSLAASIDSLGRSAYSVARVGMGMLIGQTIALTYGLQKVVREFINVNQRFAQMEITLASSLKSARAARDITNEIAIITARSPLPFQSIARAVQSFSVIPQVSGNLRQQAVAGTLGDPNGFLRKATRLVEQMSAFRPDQGPEGAVFALRELLGGQSRSLIRRFDVPIRLITQTDAAKGKNFAQLKNDPDQLFRAVQEAFSKIISPEAIAQFARQPAVLFQNFIEQVFELALLRIGQSGVYSKVLTFFQRIFDYVAEGMKGLTEGGYMDRIGAHLSTGFERLVKVATDIFNDLLNSFSIGEKSSDPLKRIADAIIWLAKVASEKVPSFIRETYLFIKQFAPVAKMFFDFFASLLKGFIGFANQFGPLSALIGAFLVKNLITNFTQTLSSLGTLTKGFFNFGKTLTGFVTIFVKAFDSLRAAQAAHAAWTPLTQAQYITDKGYTALPGGGYMTAKGRRISDVQFNQYFRQAQAAQPSSPLAHQTGWGVFKGNISQQKYAALGTAAATGAGAGAGIATATGGSILAGIAATAALTLAITALTAGIVYLGKVILDWYEDNKKADDNLKHIREEWDKRVQESFAFKVGGADALKGIKTPFDSIPGGESVMKSFFLNDFREMALAMDKVNWKGAEDFFKRLGLEKDAPLSREAYSSLDSSKKQGMVLRSAGPNVPSIIVNGTMSYEEYLDSVRKTFFERGAEVLKKMDDDAKKLFLMQPSEDALAAKSEEYKKRIKDQMGDLGKFIVDVLEDKVIPGEAEVAAAMERYAGADTLRAVMESRGKIVTSAYYEAVVQGLNDRARKSDPASYVVEDYDNFIKDIWEPATREMAGYIEKGGSGRGQLSILTPSKLEESKKVFMEGLMSFANELPATAKDTREKLLTIYDQVQKTNSANMARGLSDAIEEVSKLVYDHIPFEATVAATYSLMDGLTKLDDASAEQVESYVKALQMFMEKNLGNSSFSERIAGLKSFVPSADDSKEESARKSVGLAQLMADMSGAILQVAEKAEGVSSASDKASDALKELGQINKGFGGALRRAMEALAKVTDPLVKATEQLKSKFQELTKAIDSGPYSKQALQQGISSARTPQEAARERLQERSSIYGRKDQLKDTETMYGLASVKREELLSERDRIAKGGGNVSKIEDEIKSNETRLEQLKQELETQKEILAIENSRVGVMIGIKNGITKQIKSLMEMAEEASTAFSSGLGEAMGDFITGVKSAKEAFRDFAVSFLQMMAKMIMQQLILNALKATFGFADGGAVPTRMAAGGSIYGGSGHRDDVPIMAMGGEYIIRKDRVKKIGLPFLNWLNDGNFNGKVSQFGVPSYASGGYVASAGRPAAGKVETNIVVNVHNSEGGAKAVTAEGAGEMSKQIEAVVLRFINDEKRYGGSLYQGN